MTELIGWLFDSTTGADELLVLVRKLWEEKSLKIVSGVLLT